MNLDHYKAASERTDADERRILSKSEPFDEKAEHDNDLRWESRMDDEREASGYWDNHPDNEGDQ